MPKAQNLMAHNWLQYWRCCKSRIEQCRSSTKPRSRCCYTWLDSNGKLMSERRMPSRRARGMKKKIHQRSHLSPTLQKRFFECGALFWLYLWENCHTAKVVTAKEVCMGNTGSGATKWQSNGSTCSHYPQRMQQIIISERSHTEKVWNKWRNLYYLQRFKQDRKKGDESYREYADHLNNHF